MAAPKDYTRLVERIERLEDRIAMLAADWENFCIARGRVAGMLEASGDTDPVHVTVRERNTYHSPTDSPVDSSRCPCTVSCGMERAAGVIHVCQRLGVVCNWH